MNYSRFIVSTVYHHNRIKILIIWFSQNRYLEIFPNHLNPLNPRSNLLFTLLSTNQFLQC